MKNLTVESPGGLYPGWTYIFFGLLFLLYSTYHNNAAFGGNGKVELVNSSYDSEQGLIARIVAKVKAFFTGA